MKNILVTGGAGFIGSHLCEFLLNQGNLVICVDNLSLGKEANIDKLKSNPNFFFYKIDILSSEQFSEVFKKHQFDTIFHLAANSNIAISHESPKVDLNNTFYTTVEVLENARRFKVKEIVFASTSAIYGETNKIITEDFGPLLPVSHYGAGKLASEAFLFSYSANYNFNIWIARFPNVVGEHATHGVILDLINKLKQDPSKLSVLGNGEQLKPYIYVKELVEALVFIWTNSKGKNNIFNIGVDSRTKVSEIVKILLSELKSKAIISYTGGARGWIGDVPEFLYDTSKIRALGWEPKLTSTEAIRLAIKMILKENQVF